MIHKDHAKGAVSELFAAQYFLLSGKQVYFPVVRQGKVDFVVEGDFFVEGKTDFLRVQVKTATLNFSDGQQYLQCRIRTTNKNQTEATDGYYDVLAIVYNQELWLVPAQHVVSSNISLRSAQFPEKENKWKQFQVL